LIARSAKGCVTGEADRADQGQRLKWRTHPTLLRELVSEICTGR
jgi:hypothetical protein